MEKAGPIRLGDLAAIEGIAPSTLTRLVTHLEDSGFVKRCTDPSDARASTLAVTPKGREALDRLRAETTAILTRSIMALSPEQRRTLAAAMPVLEHLAEVVPPDPALATDMEPTSPDDPGNAPLQNWRANPRAPV